MIPTWPWNPSGSAFPCSFIFFWQFDLAYLYFEDLSALHLSIIGRHSRMLPSIWNHRIRDELHSPEFLINILHQCRMSKQYS